MPKDLWAGLTLSLCFAIPILLALILNWWYKLTKPIPPAKPKPRRIRNMPRLCHKHWLSEDNFFRIAVITEENCDRCVKKSID